MITFLYFTHTYSSSTKQKSRSREVLDRKQGDYRVHNFNTELRRYEPSKLRGMHLEVKMKSAISTRAMTRILIEPNKKSTSLSYVRRL